MSHHAKLPIAAIEDRRLSAREFKVLCALFSFADSEGHCHPKRSHLSERCGIAENHISVATAQLVAYGWLEKAGNGGRSSAMDYLINTRPKSVQVNEAVKPSQIGTGIAKITRPKLGLKPVPKQYGANEENPSQIGTKTRPELGQAPRPKLGQGIQQTISTDQQHINPPPVVPPLKQDEKSASKKSTLTPEMREACMKTWEAYAKGYFEKYGIEPVKNAKAAGQVVNFVKRIGMADAPFVAGFYTTHNARWYVQKGHSVDSMLADAEKLRMEWATNRKVTAASATHADKREAAGAAVSEYMANLEARYGTT